jgi:hypothetical protein
MVTLPSEDQERVLILIDLLEALEETAVADRILEAGVTRDVEGAYWAVIAQLVARLWAEDSGREMSEITDRIRSALTAPTATAKPVRL